MIDNRYKFIYEPPKNTNLVTDSPNRLKDNDYVCYYGRVSSKGITFGKIKQIDDNLEIIFDIVINQIISIKIIA